MINIIYKHIPTKKFFHTTHRRFNNGAVIADMRGPASWFPLTRRMRRKIIMNVGPTNSGKTHNALLSLRNASSGIYCGPLRLLAHEIYRRMNTEWNVECSLITGEERRAPLLASPNSRPAHVSCTVEMANLHEPVDVAVLDEIQMLSNPERGWAWTNALLGLQAQEIHCCGEESAVDLVKNIAKTTGDHFELNCFERLNPLVVQEETVSQDFRASLEPGDCVIAFNRKDLFNLKKKIEISGRKCALIYGGLPPETRVEQAMLFNNRKETKHDILVATDAIGMGLNLSIRRIIFSTVKKFDGNESALIEPRFVKQIAGRAGRYSLSDIEPGFVSSFDTNVLNYVGQCLNSKSKTLRQACLSPSFETVSAHAEIMPAARFYEILELIENSARLDKNYFLADMEIKKALSYATDHIDLSLQERFEFSNAPVKINQEEELDSFLEMIHGYYLSKYGSKASLRRNSPLRRSSYQDIVANGLKFEHLGLFRPYFSHTTTFQDNMRKKIKPCTDHTQLVRYEAMHRVCSVYLWLKLRYPDIYVSSFEAVEMKEYLEKTINKSLLNIGGKSSRKTLIKRLFE